MEVKNLPVWNMSSELYCRSAIVLPPDRCVAVLGRRAPLCFPCQMGTIVSEVMGNVQCVAVKQIFPEHWQKD